MRSRSTSGAISNRPISWSSIWRCCAVASTRTRAHGSRRRARMTGAILIASGRVPTTQRTVFTRRRLSPPGPAGARFDAVAGLGDVDGGQPRRFQGRADLARVAEVFVAIREGVVGVEPRPFREPRGPELGMAIVMVEHRRG